MLSYYLKWNKKFRESKPEGCKDKCERVKLRSLNSKIVTKSICFKNLKVQSIFIFRY